MKQILDLRPVHHQLEDRIRAHILLCWLALLLIRIIETTTGDTWNTIRANCNASTSHLHWTRRHLPPDHEPHHPPEADPRHPRHATPPRILYLATWPRAPEPPPED